MEKYATYELRCFMKDNYVFENCRNLTAVYYLGSDEEWLFNPIKSEFDELDDYTVYYYSASQPQYAGNYWHYGVDGKTPVVW